MKTNRSLPMATAKVRTRARAKTELEELLQGREQLLAAVSAAPVMAGLWAVASLVGAVITAGGPLGLVQGWFQAVLGL